MSRESASQAIRQLRTLHTLGVVGGLSDPQLVDRFLKREGDDREDAFAALVQRHGPMVLGVCRRMLRGSADVDDAFQAVFLVLARKARAVRNVERLKAWLYGVAVRTAKESRRRSARRQKWEGGTMDISRAVSKPEHLPSALGDLVDEEINHLPRRYREAVLLCELDGASRQDAARQLGLPEGTLSSRLARGRSLLRNRLTKRGPHARFCRDLDHPPRAGQCCAARCPESLNGTTCPEVRGGRYGPGGNLVTGEGSACHDRDGQVQDRPDHGCRAGAEQVSPRDSRGDWRENAPRSATQGPAAPASPPAVPQSQARHRTRKLAPLLFASGVVVDEAGRPVDLAEVLADAFQPWETHGATNADGSFAIHAVRGYVKGLSLLASVAGSDRIGFFQYG